MSGNEQVVGPLRKVSLILEARTGPDMSDLSAGPVSFEFIYGAGGQGLCPLEFQLADKKEGDVLSLRIRGEELSALFQHLLNPPLLILEAAGDFSLKVTIMRVSDADPREVIKAIAEAGSCGDHCCG